MRNRMSFEVINRVEVLINGYEEGTFDEEFVKENIDETLSKYFEEITIK